MNQNTKTPLDGLGADELQTLAGEYVLGTLSLQERQAVQAQLPTDPALQAAVDAWERRFLPLTSLAEPMAPSRHLWPRVERSLDSLSALLKAAGPAVKKTATPWWRDWQSLPLWQGLTAGGFAATAVLACVLVYQVAALKPDTRYMVVLVAPQDKSPGWVMQTSTAKHIELIPLGQFAVPADKALELWTKADGWNAPISLGLVTPGKRLNVSLEQIPGLQANQLFELTLEPSTGSPTGRPTGPIHFIGRSVQVL